MKSDELKFERLGDANKTYPESTLVIRKQFVDAAIAELKAENKRLNRELEHVKNGDCINTCDVVEKHVKEELKAKRALWMARAERATEKADSFIDIKVTYFGVCNINHSVYPKKNARRMLTCDEWLDVWTNVWEKCLNKAKEYK